MSILRLIASTKTTITLLLLCACISLYTVVSTHFPIPFEIPKNILYWSFISLLGLFALNQLGTFIVRLNQSNKRSKDPFFRASTAQEENEEEALSLEKTSTNIALTMNLRLPPRKESHFHIHTHKLKSRVQLKHFFPFRMQNPYCKYLDLKNSLKMKGKTQPKSYLPVKEVVKAFILFYYILVECY